MNNIDQFQKGTGYQNFLTELDKIDFKTSQNKRLNFLAKELIELPTIVVSNSKDYHILSVGVRPLGRLNIYTQPKGNFKYFQILLPFNNTYESPQSFSNTNRLNETRIIDTQMWGQYKLGSQGLKPFNETAKRFKWVEFLDWCFFKFHKDRFELFYEKLTLKFA